MSLARALTTRRKEEPAAPSAYVGRAASQRAPNAKPIKRSEISLPVALISTTNMLSYEAPDIADAPHVHSMGGRYFSNSSATSEVSSSTQSDNESEQTGSVRSYETDATSVDMSSPDLSDAQFNNYFKSPNANRTTRSTTASSRASYGTTHSQSSRPSMDSNSPRIPSRAPSHSKSAHVLSHKRSVQRMATIPSQTRESIDMFSSQSINNPPPTASHPFGKELEQLNEAAEEFGHAVRNAEADADASVMRSKGLVRFCANDYMSEISDLYSNAFEEDAATYQPMIWI